MKKDLVSELYLVVEAIESCCKLAPAGLAFLLRFLKERIYTIAVQLEEGE